MSRIAFIPAALALPALLAWPVLADSTTVEIQAADGVRLAATYTPADGPGPGVLLLHMCNSERSAWQGLAEKLALRSIHSLALDYRGYGASGGELPEDMQQRRQVMEEKWPGDIDAAFEFLRSRPGVDGERIGAAGGSCGVDQAVELAQRHPREVKTLVLLAGTTDRDGEVFLSQNPWLPILASASHDDGQAVAQTRWVLGFSSHPANRFLEYATGGHGTEMFAVHSELEPAIAGWFLEHLIRAPVRRSATARAEPGPSVKLWETLLAPGGVARISEALEQARARGQAVPLPPEGVINAEGYRRIAAGELQPAIEILAFNVAAFPQSANALDSLGDAYLAAGQTEKAAELARRAIAALADDPEIDEDFARAIRESAQGKLRQTGD